MNILYLHGFRSSPHSFKAQLVGQRLIELGHAGAYFCPQLPPSPLLAVRIAMQLVEGTAPEQLALIGSSLGGYYATWLAERIGCRAVLLNPAVKAARDLRSQVGPSTDFHTGAPFEFRPEYIDELEAMTVHRISRPERYFLLAATGDEVLDWREMAAHYPGARQRVIEGSDHGLSDFAAYVDDVLAFCGVPGARQAD